MTDRAMIFAPMDLFVFLSSDGALARLRSDKVTVTNWGEFRIPTDFSFEGHPKPAGHFPSRRDLVLVVPENHELPRELWEL